MSPLIYSSVPSKEGVVKRNRFIFSFSVDKPLSISIILNRLNNEIVKYSRYQSKGLAYIIKLSVS